MAMTSDEVNLLVFRYLQESGFVHAAFTFAHESLVARSSVAEIDVPPGALVSYLQKGLQYAEIEAHLQESDVPVQCDAPFSLVAPHVCKPKRSESKDAPGPEKADKRARTAQASTRDETTAESDDVDMTGAAAVDDTACNPADVTWLPGHTSEVLTCAWCPTANLLASGSADGTARLWNLDSPSPVSTCIQLDNGVAASNGRAQNVTSLDWSTNGSLLATASYNGQARIWSREGVLRHTLAGHEGPVFALSFNKSGALLLSGGVDSRVLCWDVASGTVRQTFTHHTSPAMDVSWRDEMCFASSGVDKKIAVCELGQSQPLVMFDGHEDEVNAVRWDSRGRLLASCSDDRTAKVWSIADGMVADLTEHNKEVYAISWSSLGLLGTASFDATVKLWDVAKQRSTATLRKHKAMVFSLAFSPDGQYVASGSVDMQVLIWSTRDGSLVKSFKGSDIVYSVSWNGEGNKIAAAFSNQEAKRCLSVIDFRK